MINVPMSIKPSQKMWSLVHKEITRQFQVFGESSFRWDNNSKEIVIAPFIGDVAHETRISCALEDFEISL